MQVPNVFSISPKLGGATLYGLSLEGGYLGANIHGMATKRTGYGMHEDPFRIDTCQVAHFSGADEPEQSLGIQCAPLRDDGQSRRWDDAAWLGWISVGQLVLRKPKSWVRRT